jgi:PKHD-type hydroxylase
MQLHNYYYWFQSAIPKEICQKILQYGKTRLQEEISLGRDTNGVTFGGNEKNQDSPENIPQNDLPLYALSKDVDPSKRYVRDSSVVWLNEQWINDIVYPFIKQANKEAGWNWQYDNFEALQFTKYENKGFYSWHQDGQSDWFGAYKRYMHGITDVPLNKDGTLPSGYVMDDHMVGKIRKLSMTINLCEPEEYDGGELLFDMGVHRDKNDRFHNCQEIKSQGSVIVFPSFVHHCVTPVTRGTRYSLVVWAIGDPWK